MNTSEYNEKICVLIPAYNMGKYLEKCIDSVLAQTYRNIRVLVIDDGSTDNTKEICDRYEQKDSRFFAIHTKNGGSGRARGIGLEHCEEDYVAMIDADDCVNTTYLEKLYEVMKKSGADMVRPYFELFSDDSEIDLNINRYASSDDYTVFRRPEAMKELTRASAYYIMPQKLYKASLFSDFNYPEVRIHEDAWAIHHLVIRAEKVAVARNSVYFWRQSPEGKTRNFSAKYVSVVGAVLDRAEVARNGYLSCVPYFEREFHVQAVEFYRKCRKRHIDGKKVLKPYKHKLIETYRFNSEEYIRLYDRKERILHWFFARNYFIFDILDSIIDDSTRDRARE